MGIKTVLNGIELKSWDLFNDWISRVITHFEQVKDYQGYPELPEFANEGIKLFDEASSREQTMIAHHSMFVFMLALQKWRTDQDTLYFPEKRAKFLEFITKVEQMGMKKHTPKLRIC